MKQFPKRKFHFDPVLPLISEDRFHKFDWGYFYRDSKEAVSDNIPKLSQVETEIGTKCWLMSSEKYVKAAIDSLESKLGKSDMNLPK